MDGTETRIIDLKNTTGRILGVDFGDTRTGVAVSDISRFLASGIGYVSPGGIEKTADKIAEIAREQKVGAIVVGLPKNMDGSEGFPVFSSFLHNQKRVLGVLRGRDGC